MRFYPLNILFVLLSGCANFPDNNENDSVEIKGKNLNITKAEVSDTITGIKIGNQTWMKTNLNVERFKNGDLIKEAKTNQEWITANKNKQPVWCYYNNDPALGDKFGKLYNWYAVHDSRGLAPENWHIPTDYEWMDFENYLGMKSQGIETLDINYGRGSELGLGSKLKATKVWDRPGFFGGEDFDDATNETGFNALPGGYRLEDKFDFIGLSGNWWCNSESSYKIAYARGLWHNNKGIIRRTWFKECGLSVRCIKN